MIWCCLRIISPFELPRLMEIGDKPKGGTISLPESSSDWPRSQSTRDNETFLTDVANEPVLQTVNTFRPSPEPPPPFTCSTNQSPPHLAIALLCPTSSAAICLPSSITSSAIARASFLAVKDGWSVRERRHVAAPRLTAVGRAVNKKSRIGVMCAARDTGEERKSGDGSAHRARVRCCKTLRAGSDAMAGAPRIYHTRQSGLHVTVVLVVEDGMWRSLSWSLLHRRLARWCRLQATQLCVVE